MAKFEKGKSGNPKGKAKGTLSEKAKFWGELREFMVNEGAEKFKEELMKLKGQSFIMSYNNALEYFQPKLSRTTLEGDKDKPLFDSGAIKSIADKINKNAAS
jgi:hypothetical protein